MKRAISSYLNVLNEVICPRRNNKFFLDADLAFIAYILVSIMYFKEGRTETKVEEVKFGAR